MKSKPQQAVRVAVIQTDSGTDIRENLKKIARLAGKAGKADLIALPEVFAMRGSDRDYRAHAETLSGPISGFAADLARSRKCCVLAGSIVEKTGKKFYNTSLLFEPSGKLIASYRKIHLFEAFLDDGRHIRESDAYNPGSRPVLAKVLGWTVGMSICFDIRFPELYRYYTLKGAQVLFMPSNFTQRTGKDHWEVLVRARAVENQCYVIAPNQCGMNTKTCVKSHGHSMIAGPWGKVLSEAGDEEEVITAVLDLEEIEKTRRRIPVLKTARHDGY